MLPLCYTAPGSKDIFFYSAFQQWRVEVGQKMKPLYEKYVELKNKRAVRNGYKDYGHEWRSRYNG